MLKNQRKLGFVLSYLSIFVSSMIGLLFTPYMISSLGPTEYGLYQLLYSVIGYIALLDFGLGGTLTRFILKYKAENNREKINSVITMCVKIYCIFGAVIMAIVWIFSLNLDTLFKTTITAENFGYAQKLFMIMGATTSISLISHALVGVETAHEKYAFTKGIYILRQLSRVAIMIVLFDMGFGAMAIVTTDLIVTVVLVLLDIIYCKFVLKEPILKGRVDTRLIKPLFSFSIFVFLQIIVTQINVGIDKVILGRYSCLEYVALYGVAMQLYSLFNSIGGVIVGITLPKISEVVFGNGSVNEVTDCCVKYSRMQLHILAPIITGFIVLGKIFISIWVPEYDSTDVYVVALLLIVPQILESVEGTVFNVMKAKNLQATRSIILFMVALLHIILSVCLLKPFPLYGPALGTFISFVIGNNIISNIYYHKKVGINMFRYFKNLFKGILPTILISLMAGVFINQIPVTGWLGFIVKGCCFVAVYGIVILLIGLDKYEKSVAKSILKKFRR